MPTETAKPKPTGKKAAPDDGLTLEERLERDAARYEALAREHGADLSEEGFNEALRKIGRRTPPTSKD